jgi:molybdopterin-containing oxidoreductase family molybdopterin binding subunit
MIVDSITTIQEKYGKDSVLYYPSGEGGDVNYKLMPSLLGVQHAYGNGVDIGVGNGMEPAVGSNFGNAWKITPAEFRDWVNTKFMIMIGRNFVETQQAQSRALFNAKEAGCRIVNIDPHFSVTASKCDSWIPINPGTDAALFLGMTSEIIDKNLVDENFMKKHTSFPFLIDTEDGKFVRNRPIEKNALVPESGEENAFYVWDVTVDALVPYNSEGVEPALQGRFTFEGKVYKTVYQVLLETQSQYSPTWASKICGIHEDIIKELAADYATVKPSAIVTGWASDKYTNADISGHAAIILAGITGQIGYPGSGVGGFLSGYYASMASWPLPTEFSFSATEVAPFDCRIKPNRVKAVINVGDTFQQYYANMNLTRSWVDSLDFILCIDVYYSESVRFADIVLPACSKFETEEKYGGVLSRNNHLLLRQKVLDPLFESKSDFQIEMDILKAFGFEEYLPESIEEYIRYQLDNSPDQLIAGITLEDLDNNQGVIRLKEIEQPFRATDNQTYNTPSGRLEVYYETLFHDNQALPTYENPIEIYADNQARTAYPLQIGEPKTRFKIHTQFFDATWLQQFYAPYLELNSIDFNARYLSDDDIVEVFNDRGSFSCQVKCNESVRPGSVRIFEGAPSRYMNSGNYQDVTNDTIIERGYHLPKGPVIPYSDTLVEVRKVSTSEGGAA